MKIRGLKTKIISLVLAISLLSPATVFAAPDYTEIDQNSNVQTGNNSVWVSNGEFSYQFATVNIDGQVKADILTDIKTGESHLAVSGLSVTNAGGIDIIAEAGAAKTKTNVQVLADFKGNEIDPETGMAKVELVLKGANAPKYPINYDLKLGDDIRVILTRDDGTKDIIDAIGDITKIPEMKLSLIKNGTIYAERAGTKASDYLFSSLDEYLLYKYYEANDNGKNRTKAIGKNAAGLVDFSSIESDPKKAEKLQAIKSGSYYTSAYKVAEGDQYVCVLLEDKYYTDLNDYAPYLFELKVTGTDEYSPAINDMTLIWDTDAKAPLPGITLVSGTPRQKEGSIIATLQPKRTNGTSTRRFDDVTDDKDLIVKWYKKDKNEDEYPATPFFDSSKNSISQAVEIPSKNSSNHGFMAFSDNGLIGTIGPSSYANGFYKAVIEDNSGNWSSIEKQIEAWDTEAPLLKADIYVYENNFNFAKVKLIAEDDYILADKPFYFGEKKLASVTDDDFSAGLVNSKNGEVYIEYTLDENKKYYAYSKDKAENISGVTKQRYILCDKDGNPIGNPDDIPYEDTEKEGEIEIKPEYIDNTPPRVTDIVYTYEPSTKPGHTEDVVVINVKADNGKGTDGTGLQYMLTYAGKNYPPKGDEQVLVDWNTNPKFEEPFDYNYDSDGDGTPDTDMYTDGYYKVYVKDAAGNVTSEIIFLDPEAVKALETGKPANIDSDGDGNCDKCGKHVYKDSDSDGNCDTCNNKVADCTGCKCYEIERYNVRLHLPQPSGWVPGKKTIRITTDDTWKNNINSIEYKKDDGNFTSIDLSTVSDKSDWNLEVFENGVYTIKININGKTDIVTMSAIVEKIDSTDPTITADDSKLEKNFNIELHAKENGTDTSDKSGLQKITVAYSDTDATVTNKTESIIWITGSDYVDSKDLVYTPMAKGFYKFYAYDKSGRIAESKVCEVKYLNLNPILPSPAEAQTEEGKKKIRDLITQNPLTYTNGNVTLTLNLDDMTGLGVNPFMWEYEIPGKPSNKGTDAYASSKTYVATENQIVTLRIKDAYGNNYESLPININIIDRTAPVITVEQKDSKFEVTVTDNLSGIDTVKWSGGALAKEMVLASESSLGVTAKTYTVDIPASGTYSFIAVDKAGNATPADSPVNKTATGIGNESPVIEDTPTVISETVNNYYSYNYSSGQGSNTSGKGSTTINNYYQQQQTPSSQASNNNSQVDALQRQLATLQQSLAGSNTETDKLKSQLDAMNKANANKEEKPAASSSSEKKEEVKEEEPKEEEKEAEVVIEEPVSVPTPLAEEEVTSFEDTTPGDDSAADDPGEFKQAEEITEEQPDEVQNEKKSRLPLILIAVGGFALLAAAIAYFMMTKKNKSAIDDELLDIDDFSEESYTSEDEDTESEDEPVNDDVNEVFDAEDIYK